MSYRFRVTSYVFCGLCNSKKVVIYEEFAVKRVGCIALIYNRANKSQLECMFSGITMLQFEDFRIITWSIVNTLSLTFLILWARCNSLTKLNYFMLDI